MKREKVKRLKQRYEQALEKPGHYKTLSGIPIAPLYTPADVPDFDYLRDLGFPGQQPYTRGVYPTMYRGRPWTIRQLAGFGTPEETNERIKLLLRQGATGINLTFDYPTLRGYDSDDPISEADAGLGGVAIDSLSDMDALFADIPIDKISVSMVNCNPSMAVTTFAMYLAMAERRGIEFSTLSGTNQNDFLMETLLTNAPEVIPPRHSFRLCCDLIEFCIKQVPGWNPVSYTGYSCRASGATAVQEVAFALSNAIACTQEMIRRGWKVDSFAPRLSFFFSAHNDLFEEIAKYRAARRLWYRIMRERFNSRDHRSCSLRFHVQTYGVSLTAQQPLNNIARAAYQALAAVLGGAQSLHVDAYDEALCIPTEQSALVALRTQQIIQYETNVLSTVDPLGGSYYMEFLTNEIERRISDYMKRIESMGGIVSATETGSLHREIAESAYQYQRALESGELKMVGVNCFQIDEEPQMEVFRVSGTAERQRAKLERLRKQRDIVQTQRALNKLREKCQSGENLMPAVLEAVKASATIGEITAAFRQEFGLWRMPLI